MIAVTTPTGNIGRIVTKTLLDAGADVVLLVRDPAKVGAFAERGAEARQGSLEDEAYVIDATRGADALFWLTPAELTAEDFRGFQCAVGANGAAAVRENKIPHVVNLSSVGAHLEAGTGPIAGLRDVEQMLDEVATHVTHLRPTYFFENFLAFIEPMRDAGSIFLPVSGETRLPMIATRDIGPAAAARLLDDSWTGTSVQELHGPADLSFDEAAAAISEGVGRPIAHVQVDEGQTREALLGMGLSANVADTLIEMYGGFDSGLIGAAQERSPDTTTPTTLIEFAREVIAPML